jgi:DNA repair protein RadC
MKGRLRDLTKIDTIYRVETLGRRKVQTIRVRRRQRFMTQTKKGGPVVVNGLDVVLTLFRGVLAGLEHDQEHWVMLVLDATNQAEGYKIIGSGAQNRVDIDCAQVFRSALLLGARSIVVAHNQPSGQLAASPRDLKLTTLLAFAGKVLDIPVLDHLILGQHTDYVSLYDKHPTLFMAMVAEPGDTPAGSDAAG